MMLPLIWQNVTISLMTDFGNQIFLQPGGSFPFYLVPGRVPVLKTSLNIQWDVFMAWYGYI